MGAKAPIFSEFGAKARNRFRPAPTKKEKQRLSTIFKTTIGAKAPNFTEVDAEAHLPPNMKKTTKLIKNLIISFRFYYILASFWIDFSINLGQFLVHVASWVGSWG